jgi:hypothetical protein
MDNAATHVKAACRSSFDKSIDRAMKKAEPQPADAKSAADRAARLAQALRANLHRRKAQARAIDDGADGGEESAGKPGQ